MGRAKWKENTETDTYKHLHKRNPAHNTLNRLIAETNMYNLKKQQHHHPVYSVRLKNESHKDKSYCTYAQNE